MANRVPNLSDLIHRVASSCLQNQIDGSHHESTDNSDNQTEYQDPQEEEEEPVEEGQDSEEKGERNGKNGVWVDERKNKMGLVLEREREMEVLMTEVFVSVSAMKKAYVSLQEAHSPWDQEKMSVADSGVITELRKLGVLREKFRRRRRGNGEEEEERRGFNPPLREVVAPYEAAIEDLKREVKIKEVEIQNLKEKLKTAINTNWKKGKFQSKKRISYNLAHVAAAPSPELFEATMTRVKESSKNFTSLLLSLMHSARWDISAAVRSIESATTTTTITVAATGENLNSLIGPYHAKYALESYISHKIFNGFDHETFYIDGSLSSLLNPDQFRRDCFTQFRDMRAMEPAELLGILPTCHFGKFCFKKFLEIVHPKMEESLFGNLDHHSMINAGNHPRSQFYGEFLRLTKSVWLLHLLGFALDPVPSHFQVSKGAEFQAECMESVVKFSGGRVPVGQIVRFPVSPGFNFANGPVIKARVYLVSKT